jgi:hypothetical protein
MALDLFVRAERAIRIEGGSFTRALGRVPDVLGALPLYYHIDVARVGRDQLLVVASGEVHRDMTMNAIPGIAGDRVAIDERFRVKANFPFPTPPRDYLHVLARNVMNRIVNEQLRVPSEAEISRWEGVFHGYFKYDVRTLSQGGKTVVATGVAAPVKGEVIDIGGEGTSTNLYEWVYNHRHTIGLDRELLGGLEKIYLAERIYHEHTGVYAPTFQRLIPANNGLASYGTEGGPFAIQEFQIDPTFGFHAELAERAPDREPAGSTNAEGSGIPRAWSVNGYGQVSQVSSIEGLMQQFENTRDSVARHGVSDPAIGDWKAQEATKARKPLLIDAVEGDK